VQRAKLVPASALTRLPVMAAGFARVCRCWEHDPDRPGRARLPDSPSLGGAALQRNVAWVATDLQVEGQRWSSRRAGC